MSDLAHRAALFQSSQSHKNIMSASADGYTRKNPFPAPLSVHTHLCSPESVKDTRHFELSLAGSGVEFTVGDSLGVYPENDPELVEELLRALGLDGEEAVPQGPDGETSLRRDLTTLHSITGTSRKFIKVFAERSGDFELQNLLKPEMSKELKKHLDGREVIDFFLKFPGVKFEAAEFVGLLAKLQPRLYSIASSLKAHPDEVHLTVARVEYETFGRNRKGVCSTFMSDRVADGGTMKVFNHVSKGFRVPEDPSKDMIMVGPGTGIAPFRAFVQERRATGATGRNWMFFGNPHQAHDYCYGEEFDSWLADGSLARLDLAWSRDQAHKIYVQNKIQEASAEIWAWVDAGSHFYVCGDAIYMAGDVDKALHGAIQTHGGRTEEEAIEYVKQMKKDKRYQLDVY
ncbi:MAG: sulfite reductase (NADPH) flavoprotein alpha-component [Verrucomicrobiales bacterium]